MRPVAVTIILSVWSIYVFQVGISAEDMMNLASAAVFYLFGERTSMYLGQTTRK